MPSSSLLEIRGWIHDASAILVMTGAGISADSGVPTFRGAGGLWRQHRPEELATAEAFARDPALVWAWYDWRRSLISGCAPNAAHQALVALEERCPRFLLATQNVDGLHGLAGSRDVIELHGAIFTTRCQRCGASREDRSFSRAAPPRCAACGGPERPGVVWFGESLPVGAMERAADAALTSDLTLIIGTSGVVYPAAGLAELAHRAGKRVVIVNLDPIEQVGFADGFLQGRAADVVPALVD
ncbi:MAG: NAD-dependent deacylase [Pseudomonadota bacterium]